MKLKTIIASLVLGIAGSVSNAQAIGYVSSTVEEPICSHDPGQYPLLENWYYLVDTVEPTCPLIDLECTNLTRWTYLNNIKNDDLMHRLMICQCLSINPEKVDEVNQCLADADAWFFEELQNDFNQYEHDMYKCCESTVYP